MPLTLTYQDTSTIINALRVARERFQENAKMIRAEMPGVPAYERVAAQFDRQAEQSGDLADSIENMEGDTILPQCW